MNNVKEKRPYRVDEKILHRFDQRCNVFGRLIHDSSAPFFKKGMYDEVKNIVEEKKEGYSREDFAMVLGSWTAYDYYHQAFSWTEPSDANNIMKKPIFPKYEIDNLNAFTARFKQSVYFFGADLVGVTKVDDNWLYDCDLKGKKIEIPRGVNSAVVFAVKMNPENMMKSPSFVACAETGLAYSKLAFLLGCISEYIRRLGYVALPMGNDSALSIPLAIDAGLGELGRNGLLITPEFGPCVRLAKVLTDLPLSFDSPKTFGVEEFCKTCLKCADSCEADAIQTEKEPSFKKSCESNSSGVFRWAVNHDKCYEFWIKNGGECSNCIVACPFFKKAVEKNSF